jgi:hypothetical protein
VIVGDGHRFHLLNTAEMTPTEMEDFQTRLPLHLECHGHDAISDLNYYQLAVRNTAFYGMSTAVAQAHPTLEGLFNVCMYPNSARSVSHRAC